MNHDPINAEDLTKEQWRDVPGYEGLYQVSDFGNVFSCESIVLKKRGGSYTKKGRIIKSSKQHGYAAVGLNKGKKRKALVHRLVLLAFIGPSDLFVDHIDGDRFNNKLSNLRYCTPRENVTFDNVARSNKAGFMGVHINKRSTFKKYIASIRVVDKPVKIGCYYKPEEAAAAYDKYHKILLARPTGSDNSDVLALIMEDRIIHKHNTPNRKQTEETKRRISEARIARFSKTI